MTDKVFNIQEHALPRYQSGQMFFVKGVLYVVDHIDAKNLKVYARPVNGPAPWSNTSASD